MHSKRSRLSRLTFLRGRERNEDSLQRKIGDGLFQTIGRPIRKKKESVDVGGGGDGDGFDSVDLDFGGDAVGDSRDHDHDGVWHEGIGTAVEGGCDGDDHNDHNDHGNDGGGDCGGDDHDDHNDHGNDGGGDDGGGDYGGGDFDCSGPGDSFSGYA
jgi:hypothetical protein